MHLMEDISPHSISSLTPGSLERDFDFFFFFLVAIIICFYSEGSKATRSQQVSILSFIRASTSVDEKSCKIEKTLHFTHFDPKKTLTSVGV